MNVTAPPGVERLIRVIEERYGLSLDPTDADQLRLIAEHYASRKLWLEAIHGPQALVMSSHGKATLLSGAARLMLREIKPRRSPRRTR